MTDKELLIQAWGKKSDGDLLTCQRLLSFDEPTLDSILFHAQQAVEKVLKTYLLSKNESFPNTHDLGLLLKRAKAHCQELEQLDGIISMNAYAVEIRYPESLEWVQEIDVHAVVKLAETACALICSKIDRL